MPESDFQRAICERLTLQGRRVLRVSDGTDARHGVYGLRAITQPRIDATGADLLVLPATGMPCRLIRSSEEAAEAVRAYADVAFFLELKDPRARKRGDQIEQEEWLRWVSGGRR